MLVMRSDQRSGSEHKLEQDNERRQHGDRAQYGNTVRAVASQLRSIPRAARRGERGYRAGRAQRRDRETGHRAAWPFQVVDGRVGGDQRGQRKRDRL